MDALPIDIISDKDFDQMAKGAKNAPQAKTPSPLAEKVDAPKPVDDSSAKVDEKKEIKAAKAEAPPPPPAPMPPPKPAEAKPEKKPPPKVDPIAETLKKEEARKRAEDKAKARAEQQQQQKQQPSFDPNKIAALLDKRTPQRTAAAGERVVQTPSLGFSGGQAVELSQSELSALRNRLRECWSVPEAWANVPNLKVVIRVLFNPDGSVQGQPQLVAGSASSLGPAMAESAVRAVLTCQPFKMLRPEHYDRWKDLEILFDPRDNFS